MKTVTVLLSSLSAVIATAHAKTPAQIACNLLQTALPGSVFLPGSANYDQDIQHSQISSTENATCSVEPASVEDITKILGIVGRKDIRSPFGVKSGGHAFNIGFSSTTGVEISMTKFSAVVYDPSTQTVKVQPGTTWDQVYAQLEQFNITVAGGRFVGVGVGGLALGGGFSWITDEYGLTVDNIVSYDTVLPNGTFTTVTDASHPDLFFALKGGLNNFGIVTSFTLKAIPIGQIWGGTITYGPKSNALVAAAVSNYSLHNTDLKAQINPVYVSFNGTSLWEVAVFYNSPNPPPSLFQPFLDIPAISTDLSTRSFTDFMNGINTAFGGLLPARGVVDTVPLIKYTPKVIEAIQLNVDATYAQAIADNRSIASAFLVVEPFFNPFAHSVPSAYPHDSSRPLTPSNPQIQYNDAADADYFREALQKMSSAIQTVAVEEGQSLWTDIHYPNYALGTTPLQLLYGDNLPRLRAIKKTVDQNNIMGLTGGFKL